MSFKLKCFYDNHQSIVNLVIISIRNQQIETLDYDTLNGTVIVSLSSFPISAVIFFFFFSNTFYWVVATYLSNLTTTEV